MKKFSCLLTQEDGSHCLDLGGIEAVISGISLFLRVEDVTFVRDSDDWSDTTTQLIVQLFWNLVLVVNADMRDLFQSVVELNFLEKIFFFRLKITQRINNRKEKFYVPPFRSLDKCWQ